MWNQGRVNVENLSEKLCAAANQANWDIVMEYYLMVMPLCVNIEFDDDDDVRQICNHNQREIQEEQKQLLLDMIIETNNVTDRIINYELKSDNFPLQINKRTSVTCTNSNVISSDFCGRDLRKHYNSKCTTKIDSYESGDDGKLSDIYVSKLDKWLNFAIDLNVPSVKRVIINLNNHSTIDTAIKELQSLIEQLSQDTVKIYAQNPSTHYFEPFTVSLLTSNCIIIARNFQKWKVCVEQDKFKLYAELLDQNIYKNSQKFEPFISLKYEKFIPRQRILWIVINYKEVLFTF